MAPTITDIITGIRKNKANSGITIYEKASIIDIISFEKKKGFKLPDDVRTFYSFCNGFESEEDMFRIIPLNEIIENGHDHYTVGQDDFHIAEYMIYSDMWTLSIDRQESNSYSIYNTVDNVVKLTNSFPEFLAKFLSGGVFDGLYKWRELIEQKAK